MTTVFRASKIITMDRNRPEATHVAVKNGLIVAVGDADCGDGWGEVTRDDRFADRVILPGLVEAHAHVMAGGVWRYAYCGHYTRTDPDGRDWPGLDTYDALIDRLTAVAKDTAAGEPVVGWGFDPNFVEGRRLDRGHLDQVSTDHPVVVLHSNFHLLSCNGLAMERAGITRDSNIQGVIRDGDGNPNGEMQEFAAMGPVMDVAGVKFSDLSDADALRAYGKVARNCGVTTVADLLSDLHDQELAMVERVTGEDGFPARYVPIMNAMVDDPEREAARAVAMRSRSTDKLHLGRAKLFTDGAIQGGTAMLKAPGYFAIEDHGIWNMEVDHFRAAVKALHKAGVKTHIHTNGDAASELAISAYEAAMLDSPNPDLRHTLEHVQLAGIDQFKRMRALGLTVNLFGNHLHYFGDLHWAKTVGPDRAARMDACADAAEVFGGDFAIHSDAPVTPMAPLFTAWCAVNRLTEKGRQLGTSQQISVAQALYCITMGAAYVLKMDDQIGSIQCGKRADFCVVDRDPLAVDPVALRDVQPVATVLGGEVTA
ncbi:Exoenzymes regulatory protein AepA in lipid-linked oligosaccharide synthesis cluster [Rhodovulum sp. P5]|uniref:amidohydrolase n=1 Tax=Rhodovulum sp. P5 TaxID=1564506 RepID=UPI0009C20C85|nr:amidohydrolase [Rhodovulum sp. P5]ARE42239.1 Exoenzymes regulatory protein AepA in lipid-linked oligosaccharide synthesis cluster [Rhodovulum sp. P5]